jgi:hypothetical protein
MTDPAPQRASDGYEFEFRLSNDPDSDKFSTTIVVSDDELREVGWLVDTKALEKKGWEDRYLAALSITGRKVDAADAAGVSVRHVERRRSQDAVFDTLCQEALSRRNALLEDTLTDYALHGVPEVYTNRRGETKERRRHDPRLLTEVSKLLVPHLREGDRRAALEGGIVVRLQIGDGPPRAELPALSIDGDAEEIGDDTAADGS